MGQRGRRAGKVVVSALIGASIRLSFRGVGCVGGGLRRMDDVGQQWFGRTRVSLWYIALGDAFFSRRTSNLSLSLSLRFPIFSFSPLSPLSLLPLVYEVGNELWQLAARKNTATAIHANLSPTFEGRKKFSLAVIGLGLGPTAIVLPSSTFKRRLIGRTFSPSSSSSFPFLLFLKLSSSLSSLSPLKHSCA